MCSSFGTSEFLNSEKITLSLLAVDRILIPDGVCPLSDEIRELYSTDLWDLRGGFGFRSRGARLRDPGKRANGKPLQKLILFRLFLRSSRQKLFAADVIKININMVRIGSQPRSQCAAA